MRITTETIDRDNIIVLLDGEMIGCVIEADNEEGWVDQLLPAFLKNMPEGFNSEPDAGKLVRKTGKVTFQTLEESYAKLLENYAERIRSGEIKVTGLNSANTVERWWSNDKWEYFRIGNSTFGISYNDPEFLAKELARKEAWLKENPEAENHGIVPPIRP